MKILLPVWGLMISSGALLAGLTNLARRPWGDWDSIMIWNLRARFLYRAGEDWALAFKPPIIHTDYPLLWPLIVMRQWRYTGSESFLASQSVSLAFLLAGGLVLWGTLRILRGSMAAWLGLLLLIANPFIMQFGSLQLADVPIGVLLLAGWAMLVMALRQEVGIVTDTPDRKLPLWALAGVMFGCMLWLKNEGQLMLLATAMGLAIARPMRWWSREGRKPLLVMGLALAPFALAMLSAKLLYSGSTDLMRMNTPESIPGKIIQWERHTTILITVWKVLVASPSLWIHIVLLPVVLLAGWHIKFCGRVLHSLGIMILLVLLGYYTVYLITPHDVHWHVITSVRRLVTHLWPVLVFWAMLGIHMPRWNHAPVVSRTS